MNRKSELQLTDAGSQHCGASGSDASRGGEAAEERPSHLEEEVPGTQASES